MESKSKKKGICKVVLFLLLTAMLLPDFVSAQTFSEFFKQKSTQRKYLLEQILALRSYASMAKRGYDIARDGLHTVREFTGGEFRLHELFFTDLQKINPIVRNNPKIPEILAMQRTTARLLDNLRYPEHIGQEHRDYLMTVRESLIRKYERDMDELLLVTSTDMTTMNDTGRLEKLNAIHHAVTDKMLFARWLNDELETWRIQSGEEARSLKNLRRLYDEKD